MTASGRDIVEDTLAGAPAPRSLLPHVGAGAFFAPPMALAPQAPQAGAPWYTIRAEAGATEAEIEIYGIIGEAYDWWTGERIGTSAQSFIEDLKDIPSSVTKLKIRINSPGGDVFDGSTIFNRLVQWSGTKEVVVDGLAASAASVIAMAGDTISMPPTAMLMIHNPWTFGMGEAADFRKIADTLDTIRSAMMSAYQRKNPEMSEADLIAALDAETWYTAQAAVDAGFADEVLDGAETAMAQTAQFRAHIRQFSNAPKAFVEKLDAVAAQQEAEMPNENNEVETVEETPDAVTTETEANESVEDLRAQVTALSATVTAMATAVEQAPKPQAEAKPADANSPAVKAMRSLAAVNDRADEFDDAIAAGRSLEQLQARFVDGQADRTEDVNTAAVTTDAGTEKAAQAAIKPSDYYAHRKAQNTKKGQ